MHHDVINSQSISQTSQRAPAALPPSVQVAASMCSVNTLCDITQAYHIGDAVVLLVAVMQLYLHVVIWQADKVAACGAEQRLCSAEQKLQAIHQRYVAAKT